MSNVCGMLPCDESKYFLLYKNDSLPLGPNPVLHMLLLNSSMSYQMWYKMRLVIQEVVVTSNPSTEYNSTDGYFSN